MRVALGGCLLALQAGLLIPLVYEVSANRSGKGISLLAEALWVSAGLGWLTYGMLSGSSVLVASGALAFAGSAVVGSLIYRSKSPRERRDAWVGAVLTAAIYAVSSRLWGLPGISAALSVFGVIQFLPQVRTSIHALRTATGSGVPRIGSAMRAVYTFTWAVYAGAWFLWGISFQRVDYPLVFWGLAGSAAFLLQFLAGVQAARLTPDQADPLPSAAETPR